MDTSNTLKLNNSSGEILYEEQKLPQMMKVQKRGTRGYEMVKFDKITLRISNLCSDLSSVDPTKVALATIKGLYDGISTEELDKISARTAESYKLIHPNYSKLAARILISNLHKTTPNKFSQCMKKIHERLNILSDIHYNFIMQNADILDDIIDNSADFNFDYFGYKTLENSYLYKITEEEKNINGNIVYVDRDDNIVSENLISYTEGGIPVLRNNCGTVISILRAKSRDIILDRPQYMFLRVAITININDDKNTIFENIKQCYTYLSQMYFTHATPTLFNACTKIQQLNSCFLLGTQDSIEGIMTNLSNAAFISKQAGGIGIHMSNIRCHGQLIKSTNGKSSGLVTQLKIYNETACAFDQGGKRKGAFAIYLEPWHGDIMKFLEMKLNQGAETERARDLFYALWIPDLFVKRLLANNDWSLFSEDTAPGLNSVYDGMEVCDKCGWCNNIDYINLMEKSQFTYNVIPKLSQKQNECKHEFTPRDIFTQLYTKYEENGLAIKVLHTRDVMDSICRMQRESGTPYICFKDHINRMSNQSNIGTIKSSNLCAEIMEWSSAESYACCTLASINLKKFIVGEDCCNFDFKKLHEVARICARNLDIIVDINNYPVAPCEKNSQNYRPIGIGIQALADVFSIMKIPFLSDKATKLDLAITETIYHAALTESCARAKIYGSYSAFKGSPASRGLLQFDLWEKNQNLVEGKLTTASVLSGLYDWNVLKEEIKKFGLRNSLHLAFMPTVSTSQILGNNESFEPFNSNIYTKTTLSGKFTVCNNMMINHLIEHNLWNNDIKNRIINDNGSIAKIAEIPENVKEIYKTIWELPQKELMKRSLLRSAFVDQSQSLNIYLNDNSDPVLRGVFITGWKLGLKTGSYYIRTTPATSAMKNNIADMKNLVDKNVQFSWKNLASDVQKSTEKQDVDDTECTMCSS